MICGGGSSCEFHVSDDNCSSISTFRPVQKHQYGLLEMHLAVNMPPAGGGFYFTASYVTS